MSISRQACDVIIVGGGGAGLRAALPLASSGLKTVVVSKLFPTRSHTVSAQGGINAALGNTDGYDDWRWHMYDTVKGSDFLADQASVEYMCKNALATVYELEHMGMPFTRNEEGKIYQRAFGGQTREFGGEIVHRTCAVADRTGHALLHTLYQKNIEAKTCFYNEWYAVDLVKSSTGGIAGIIALCIETGEVVFLQSRATVLATGGAGRIFSSTTNAYSNTGDGLGMVARAGLPLQDMEMWQFHPTGIAGVGCLVSEATRGEGGYLINKEGERYMERYSPQLKDLSCRDIVSRSSMREILEGRGCGPKGDYVLLKLDHLGEKILKERLPGITELAKTFANVDPAKEPIPVAPTCHYMMGGIPTTIEGQVITQVKGNDQRVEGLYAAGECACVSVHGANRLGANSLLDIVVFGRAVGLHLQDVLKGGLDMPLASEDDIEVSLARLNRWNATQEGEDFTVIRDEMRQVMQEDFGVFRTGKAMKEGLGKLKALYERSKQAALKDTSRVFNTSRIEALEFDNLMEVALATALLAESRKESRGAHSRVDFPKRDDKKWHKHQLCYNEGHKITSRSVNEQPLEIDPFPLEQREEKS